MKVRQKISGGFRSLRRRDRLRRHPLPHLDRQEAGLERHSRSDPRPSQPGKISTPCLRQPDNLGSNEKRMIPRRRDHRQPLCRRESAAVHDQALALNAPGSNESGTKRRFRAGYPPAGPYPPSAKVETARQPQQTIATPRPPPPRFTVRPMRARGKSGRPGRSPGLVAVQARCKSRQNRTSLVITSLDGALMRRPHNFQLTISFRGGHLWHDNHLTHFCNCVHRNPASATQPRRRRLETRSSEYSRRAFGSPDARRAAAGEVRGVKKLHSPAEPLGARALLCFKCGCAKAMSGRPDERVSVRDVQNKRANPAKRSSGARHVVAA